MRITVKAVLVCALIFLSALTSLGQQSYNPDEKVVYKKTDQGELALHIYYPEERAGETERAVVVSFFGGGWSGGSPKQFYQQSSYFASLGMVAISAEYRVSNKHKTTPFVAVEDAKSVINWVRTHAKELKIDPNKIVASGGSAGGHLAACTAVIDGLDVETNGVSSRPNLMILFNPVLDTTEKGYGSGKVKGRTTEISPCHHVKTGIVPTLILHGTADTTVPFENAQRFERLMKEAGNECNLIPAFGQNHGFFNSSWFKKSNDDNWFLYSLYQSEIFLWKHRFITDEPTGWDMKLESDFFKKNLDAANYHTMRQGLKNSQIIFEQKKRGTVAFLGGSITNNKGWRDMVCSYLQERFTETEFTFIAAGAPSEGTTSGAFRLDRDVLSKGKVDLLFEEAAVNDASDALGRSSKDRQRGMEGIVRHALNSNPAMDIVMMHFVDPGKMESYRKGETPEEIADHDIVAKHYNIPTINLAKEVTERIDAEEFTWKDDFKNLHPSPFGQKIYFNSMKTFLDNAYYATVDDDDKVEDHTLPEQLDQMSYINGKIINIDDVKLSKGWNRIDSWAPPEGGGRRKGYFDIPVLEGDNSSKPLQFKFEGTTIGIIAISGADSGILEYSIDGEDYEPFDQYTKVSGYLYLGRYYILASDLDPDKKHTLKLKLSDDKNRNSKGNVARICSFLINR